MNNLSYLTTSIKGKVIEALAAGNNSGSRMDKVIQNVMKQRRFFITKAGHFGAEPCSTSNGHMVYVIKGYNFPIILQKEKGHYLLVGEAFGKLK